MTISTLINSLAWGSSAQPRLRASLIKDQYGFAVYFYSTKGDMELFTVHTSEWYRSSQDMYRQRLKVQNETICKYRTVSWYMSNGWSDGAKDINTFFVNWVMLVEIMCKSPSCRSELHPKHTNPLRGYGCSNSVKPIFQSVLTLARLTSLTDTPAHCCEGDAQPRRWSGAKPKTILPTAIQVCAPSDLVPVCRSNDGRAQRAHLHAQGSKVPLRSP